MVWKPIEFPSFHEEFQKLEEIKKQVEEEGKKNEADSPEVSELQNEDTENLSDCLTPSQEESKTNEDMQSEANSSLESIATPPSPQSPEPAPPLIQPEAAAQTGETQEDSKQPPPSIPTGAPPLPTKATESTSNDGAETPEDKSEEEEEEEEEEEDEKPHENQPKAFLHSQQSPFIANPATIAPSNEQEVKAHPTGTAAVKPTANQPVTLNKFPKQPSLPSSAANTPQTQPIYSQLYNPAQQQGPILSSGGPLSTPPQSIKFPINPNGSAPPLHSQLQLQPQNPIYNQPTPVFMHSQPLHQSPTSFNQPVVSPSVSFNPNLSNQHSNYQNQSSASGQSSYANQQNPSLHGQSGVQLNFNQNQPQSHSQSMLLQQQGNSASNPIVNVPSFQNTTSQPPQSPPVVNYPPGQMYSSLPGSQFTPPSNPAFHSQQNSIYHPPSHLSNPSNSNSSTSQFAGSTQSSQAPSQPIQQLFQSLQYQNSPHPAFQAVSQQNSTPPNFQAPPFNLQQQSFNHSHQSLTMPASSQNSGTSNSNHMMNEQTQNNRAPSPSLNSQNHSQLPNFSIPNGNLQFSNQAPNFQAKLPQTPPVGTQINPPFSLQAPSLSSTPSVPSTIQPTTTSGNQLTSAIPAAPPLPPVKEDKPAPKRRQPKSTKIQWHKNEDEDFIPDGRESVVYTPSENKKSPRTGPRKGKPSFKSVAYEILKRERRPLQPKEIVAIALAEGYYFSLLFYPNPFLLLTH